MERKPVACLGALCGAAFPVALSLGRDGVMMLAVAGLVLFIPFLAYVCTMLRRVEHEGEWLAAGAFGAGLMGITLKLASGLPEIAQRGVPTGSTGRQVLDNLANAATVVSLYPFAVFCGIVAAQALRTHVLPRWLGVFAGVTAVALAVNGSFAHAGTVPALLLFVVWSFVAGIALFLRELRPQTFIGAEPATAG